ncbi:MAG: extracellular solute-binding protein, partial [Chloroflexota bacterium]|nr:extracellular solute-binding protein [Chloroflexota bacterium]
MRKRIWFVCIALFTVASLVLSACGPAEAPTEEPVEEPTQAPVEQSPEEKVTIRMSTWAGVEESAELQAVIDEVNAQVDHFEIVHEPAPDDYYTKIQTTLAGGTAADLFWLSQEWIAGMATDGALLDITDYLDAHKDLPAADPSDYFPGIISTAMYEGRYYGLPWIAQPVVMFYNKALFDAAVMDYPTLDWTWDDFESAAAALTQDTDGDGANDQWGFTMNGW